jgi:hypothetical protein
VLNVSPPGESWPRKPSATSVLETAPMKRAAREELSLIVCDRAPWSVKCSVVSAVKSSARSGESASRRKLGEWPDGHRRDSIEIDRSICSDSGTDITSAPPVRALARRGGLMRHGLLIGRARPRPRVRSALSAATARVAFTAPMDDERARRTSLTRRPYSEAAGAREPRRSVAPDRRRRAGAA